MTPGPGIAQTSLPKGFSVSGVNCGIRKYRPDLGIIISDKPAAAAGVFTLSTLKAAPILYCQKILPSDGIRAIITNSGQANAATGEAGMKTNQIMVDAVAKGLGCKSEQVLSASTGVIGIPLKVDKIVEAIPELLARTATIAEPFALAILTTDLVPKTVSTELHLKNGTIKITGICKGSGMIHPNMATMLGYILTDAVVAPSVLQDVLKQAVDVSFNMISVDRDTSTNDSVFLMANGASNVNLATDSDLNLFKKAIADVCIILAKSIARDGEGATKLVEVNVTGADNKELAKAAAKGVNDSLLVKTAIHGADPNWGRVLASLGANGVPAKVIENLSLKIQNVLVYNKGPVSFDINLLREELKKDPVIIDLDFKSGSHSVTAWSCDLSKKYIEINAEYST